MKKMSFFISIMLVVAAIAVVVVSCKKENPESLLNNKQQPVKTFTPPQVDDMNAYLKDFKQKMQAVTRDGEETLSLEEAAWHLSSVANYDFANVNVEFSDLRYDTLRYQVNVTNGQVALTDLNAVYQRIASDIDDFYQSLNLENKHFRFIGASISNSGEVIITMITTWLDHTWYFPGPFTAGEACDSLFSEDSVYVWNGLGASELERVINLLESREYSLPNVPSSGRVYFVYTTDVWFDFRYNIDLYGSPFVNNSRIYAKDADSYATPVLSVDEMCYCLDSYLGLGFEYVNDHNLIDQRPVHWFVEGDSDIFPTNPWPTYYHNVNIVFGQPIESGEIPPQY